MKSTKAVKASSPPLPTTTATTTATISANPPISIATAIATKTATMIVIVIVTGTTVAMTKIGNETEIDAIKTMSVTRMLSLASRRGWRNWRSVRKRNLDSRIWVFFFRMSIWVYLNLNFR